MSYEPLILVVEDEPPMRRLLRSTLQSHGYRVLEAATGAEGLALFGTNNPDLVVLDLGLPDLDGLEVTRRVRAGSATPIVVLSARGREADKVEVRDAGADDYVPKPFDLDELLARVRGLLRRQIWERRRDAADQALPAGGPGEEGAKDALAFGPCSVDFHTWKAVGHDGAEVQLSSKEAAMMRVFAQE